MWRNGATQRRGARGTPKGCRRTYELLCDVKPEVTRERPALCDGRFSNGVKLESKYPQHYQWQIHSFKAYLNRCSSSGEVASVPGIETADHTMASSNLQGYEYRSTHGGSEPSSLLRPGEISHTVWLVCDAAPRPKGPRGRCGGAARRSAAEPEAPS